MEPQNSILENQWKTNGTRTSSIMRGCLATMIYIWFPLAPILFHSFTLMDVFIPGINTGRARKMFEYEIFSAFYSTSKHTNKKFDRLCVMKKFSNLGEGQILMKKSFEKITK